MQRGDRSSEPDDAEAIAAIANADPAATERFVRSHAGWMLAVATRIVRDAHHAEDAVQNAFAKVFDNIGSFDGRSALKTWIHRIVVNESLMLLRKDKRSQTVAIDELQPVFDNSGCRIEDRWTTMETPESLLVQSDIRAQVNGKIDLLPDNYRIILVLRDIEEMTTQEVAQLLDISEANVKVRLHRARAALKQLLEPMIRGQAV
ncbi:sigma-70 family RNA polymerase sigma factor [Hoeflea sp.]|uniref:sigma-70 family RNA polymerase sigma factor n=1 Tax=Hoeflea sp. TaxID=1940281 RepID=UPI003B01A80F